MPGRSALQEVFAGSGRVGGLAKGGELAKVIVAASASVCGRSSDGLGSDPGGGPGVLEIKAAGDAVDVEYLSG